MSETGMTSGKMTLEKAKLGRLICRIVFALAAFVAPMVIIGVKFNLFTQFNGYKITVLGLFLMIATVWRFRKRLMEWVNSWEYSVLKYIIIGFSKIWVFILLVVMLYAARNGLESLIYCMCWFSVCECVAYLAVYPVEMKFDYYVKRMIRKNERKEDLMEAMREMEGEGK